MISGTLVDKTSQAREIDQYPQGLEKQACLIPGLPSDYFWVTVVSSGFHNSFCYVTIALLHLSLSKNATSAADEACRGIDVIFP